MAPGTSGDPSHFTGKLRRDGLAGPFELADKSGLDTVCEVAMELKALQRQQNRLARLAGRPDQQRWTTLINRHMAFDAIGELFRDTGLRSVVTECFGTDLLIWQTTFFLKYAGVGENKWHHDRQFENGSDPIDLYDTSNHFSFVIALTDLGMDQGRLEYLRGSHLPIDGFDRDLPRISGELPEVVHDRITPLPLTRGQFAVFHSSVLHRSLAYGHREEDWRSGYFGTPSAESWPMTSGRISFAARLVRRGTDIPARSGSNPAGAARAIAEPIPYDDAHPDQVQAGRSVVMPFN